MKRALVLAVLSLATATVAQPPALATPAEDFQALTTEYDAAEVAFREVMRTRFEKTKSEGKRLYIPFDQTPPARFALRYLKFAEAHPQDPSAFEALERTVRGSFEDPTTRVRALRHLRARYLTDPRIKRLIVPLAISPDDESNGFVYEILARNPDREIRIFAYKALIRRAEDAIRLGDRIESDQSLRDDFEANEGRKYVEQALNRAKRSSVELEGLRQVARELYGDRVPDLSIGRPAPELVGKTLDGTDVRLSDYRGKVVVLDIWATWCGPCRQMIPHERAMVEQLKDRPFVLVSVSVDERRETLTSFLEEEPMPWIHWWNGSAGKIIDALDVDHFPTIFVIDAAGIIRAKEQRGDQLEQTVKQLIGEIEPTPKR